MPSLRGRSQSRPPSRRSRAPEPATPKKYTWYAETASGGLWLIEAAGEVEAEALARVVPGFNGVLRRDQR